VEKLINLAPSIKNGRSDDSTTAPFYDYCGDGAFRTTTFAFSE